MDYAQKMASLGYEISTLLFDSSLSEDTLRRSFMLIWNRIPFAEHMVQINLFIQDEEKVYRSIVDIQEGQLYLESNYLSEYQVRSVLPVGEHVVRIQRGDRFEIWIPIVGETLVGFIVIISRQNLVMLPDESLVAFQQTISLGIRHYVTIRPMRERLVFLQSLADLSRVITVSDRTEEILMNLVRAGVGLLGFDRATLFLFASDGVTIARTIHAAVGAEPIELSITPALPALTDEPRQIPDMDAVWVPILVGGKRTAALLLDNIYSLDAIPPGALQAVIELGTQVGLALSKSNLMETLNEKATKDDLTGLLRVDSFYSQGTELLRSNAEQNRPCALLMLDIDSFKEINDSYGHPAGDAILIQAADVIRNQIPSNAIAGRIGGDEFVILIPNADVEFGLSIGIDILREFQTKSGFYVPAHHKQLTVSVGVAAFPRDGDAVSDLIHIADQAMYQSKRAGKARVSVGTA